MKPLLKDVIDVLGEGWKMYWGLPPNGVYLLKEAYMADPEDIEHLCKSGDNIVIYIAATFGGLNIVYGRVKPRPLNCPVATFIKNFNKRDIKAAVKTLIEFALLVEKLPLFQINPEVVRFAGLCEEYPLICEDPLVIVNALKKVEARNRNKPVSVFTSQELVLRELVRVLRDKIEVDSKFIEVVKKVVEDPERLQICYA